MNSFDYTKLGYTPEMISEAIKKSIDSYVSGDFSVPVVDLEFEIPDNAYLLDDGFIRHVMDPEKPVVGFSYDRAVFVDKSYTERLVSIIRQPEKCLLYDFETNKGLSTTARIILDPEISEEQKRLCLLYTLMDDMLNSKRKGIVYPEAWCGYTFDWVTQMFIEVLNRFKYADRFHHAMNRKLPVYFTRRDQIRTPGSPEIVMFELEKKLYELNDRYMLTHFHAPIKIYVH